jgi:hypothetical protein
LSGRVKVLAVAVAVAAVLLGVRVVRSRDNQCSGKGCTRVLFVGNSLTYVNDLPHTFAALAKSGGHHVATGMLAPGGWRFVDHLGSANTDKTIGDHRWNYVVLQDQSQQAATNSTRVSEMYPSAAKLASDVRISGAHPVLYLTFAWQAGWPDSGLPNYQSMQDQVDEGYSTIGKQLHVPVAPVGVAWNSIVNSQPGITLWQGDGVHPTVAGTYLAACVFYATIFHQSPIGLHFHDGLPADEVTQLQNSASTVALPRGSRSRVNKPNGTS